MEACMGVTEWEALIKFWTDGGHDIQHLNIPPQIATQLGIKPTETKMTDVTGTEDSQQNALLKWKRKKHFDGTTCGLQNCTRAADGYIMDIKPTKGANGQLWYGPACLKCVREEHPTLMPLSLAELAYQRGGASDLALVLDLEVGDVLKRLAAAGVDEKGRQIIDAPLASNPVNPIQVLQQEGTIQVDAIVIPVKSLADAVQEAKGLLVQLDTFHVTNQQQMDGASSFLKEVKAKWKEIEEQRKALGGPLRGKLDEIQSYFKPALDVLLQAEGILKTKISEGARRAEEAQRAALLAAQAAHQQGDLQGTAIATQAAQRADVALAPGITTRRVLRCAIDDPSKLPGEFWSPDIRKVQAAVDAGHRQIPGVRIWQEEIVAARGQA
jgi:hypothetical protein